MILGLHFPAPNPQASLRLFCFPYAGGGALIFRTWATSLPPLVEVCLVELPGRGSRLKETPYTELKPLGEAIATYEYNAEPPFNCPITAFRGLQDKKATRDLLEAWLQHTIVSFSLHIFQGDRSFPTLSRATPSDRYFSKTIQP